MKSTRRAFLQLHPSAQIAEVLREDGHQSQQSTGCGYITQIRVLRDWKLEVKRYADNLKD